MFRDREDAGRKLGEALRRFADERPLLLGLVRGGLPVAAAAARVLGADLDALVVRKAAPPDNREFGDGAVAPDGIEVGDAPPEEVAQARREMDRRIQAYLGGRPAPDVEGRTVILVDDGLATGVTAIAAIRYARTLGPKQVIVAVPVLSEEARKAIDSEADDVVFLDCPEPFRAVGDAYESFGEVTDQEIKATLGTRRVS